MFDLQARVHLQEVEALVLAGDEFDRAGGIVVHGFRQRDRLLAHLAAGGLVEQRRRRFLDDLLVAALDRTFALAEIDHVAMLVAQHLDFDVAGIDDEFFDEDAVVAERGFGFGLGEVEAFGDLGLRMRDPHALAAAAGGGLDHHGIADLVGDLHRVLFVFDDAEMSRHRRNLGLGGGLLGFDLVAHRGDGAWIGADEDDARGLEARAETPRARTGSRSRDARPARRSCGRPPRSCRSTDNSRPRPAGRSARPRRPSRREAHRGRPRNTQLPSRSPSGAQS